MSSLPQLFLDTHRAKHFDGRHPWVLANSVIAPTGEIAAGETVELMHPNGSWIGRGVFNPASRIRVRLYQWDRGLEFSDAWMFEQLRRAIEMRRQWQHSHQSLQAIRWVNSEGDGLSGLIVDDFGGHLVLQVTSLAIAQRAENIANWLNENLQAKSICIRVDESTAKGEGIDAREEWTHGECPTTPIRIEENGLQLDIDMSQGQKTGYYLDQRANRLEAAKWALPGPLLDVCCYHGGFSLTACKHGMVSEVVAVDSSRKALEVADSNARLNGVEHIDFVQADCFEFLEHLQSEKRKFQTIVLDPPKMASNRQQLSAALRAYHRLNLAALRLLEPGGVLVTCSCSGRVRKADFVGMLSSVAKRARRHVQIVESRGADFDHPIDANCPESEYLKCCICKVH